MKDYAIFMLGPDGKVATWNSGAQRLKGYEASEILGQHFSVFYPDAERLRGHPDDELRRAGVRSVAAATPALACSAGVSRSAR